MESKKCCSPVTCCGMPMEKGCFIFSIINAVVCCLSLLGSLGFLVAIMLGWLDKSPKSDSDGLKLGLYAVICMCSGAGSAVGLIFAIFLCVGLSKNNPHYLMAYVVYGIVNVILIVLGTLGFLSIVWGQVPVMTYALIPLGIGVIYSVMLLLVHQTYKVLSTSTPVTAAGHRKLLNVDC